MKTKRLNWQIVSLVLLLATLVVSVFGIRRCSSPATLGREKANSREPSQRRPIDAAPGANGAGGGLEQTRKLEAVYSAMNGKIQFYGKVIDQEGRPVADARITYMTVTAKNLGSLRNSHGPALETVSDNHGLFYINGGSGMSLQINTIKKEGFRLAGGGNSMSYSFGSSSDPHRPDPIRPVEYLVIPLANKALEPIFNEMLHFRWNSESIKVPFGNYGEVLIVRPTRDRAVGERSGFTWNVEFEVKEGGILLKDKADRLPLAPTDGYQKSVSIGSKRGAEKWGGGVSDRYLIFRTSKGLYGICNINFYTEGDDDEGRGRVSIILNPNGDRYLE